MSSTGLDKLQRFASTTQTIFVNGEFGPAKSGATLPVFDPSTGEEFSTISAGGVEDVDGAVCSARNAFEGEWGRLSGVERGRLLSKLAQSILDNKENLAQLEARDNGKPISQARTDMVVAARYFEFYAGAADKIHGDTIPYLPGYAVQILRVPYGVTAHIIPWNYPAQMVARTLAPSLAVGNATVLKPAEDACLTSLEFARLAQEVGFPAGAINVVTGLGEEAGAALTRHRDVDLITFIGSPEVGTLVQKAAAENHVPCVLELGGKSRQIVFADADLEAAVPAIVRGIVQNAGQTCSAGSRVLVEASIYDRLLDQVGAAFRKLRVGPSQSDPDVGPVVNSSQCKRVKGFVDRARAAGIPVAGAAILTKDLPQGGYYVAPTVFGPVPTDAELFSEEVFGPVLAAVPFRDEADAIQLANATDYGLIAGLWTENGARQARVSRAIRVGQVFINCFGAGGGVELPFGGFKRSGHGREKGLAALEEFSTLKTITLKFE